MGITGANPLRAAERVFGGSQVSSLPGAGGRGHEAHENRHKPGHDGRTANAKATIDHRKFLGLGGISDGDWQSTHRRARLSLR
jgi:hypothetical protein